MKAMKANCRDFALSFLAAAISAALPANSAAQGPASVYIALRKALEELQEVAER